MISIYRHRKTPGLSSGRLFFLIFSRHLPATWIVMLFPGTAARTTPTAWAAAWPAWRNGNFRISRCCRVCARSSLRSADNGSHPVIVGRSRRQSRITVGRAGSRANILVCPVRCRTAVNCIGHSIRYRVPRRIDLRLAHRCSYYIRRHWYIGIRGGRRDITQSPFCSAHRGRHPVIVSRIWYQACIRV